MLTITIHGDCLMIVGFPYLNEAEAILNMAYELGFKHLQEEDWGCVMTRENVDGK